MSDVCSAAGMADPSGGLDADTACFALAGGVCDAMSCSCQACSRARETFAMVILVQGHIPGFVSVRWRRCHHAGSDSLLPGNISGSQL